MGECQRGAVGYGAAATLIDIIFATPCCVHLCWLRLTRSFDLNHTVMHRWPKLRYASPFSTSYCSTGFLTFWEAAVWIFQFISLPRKLLVTTLKWKNATETGSVCYSPLRQRHSDSQNNVDVSSCHNPCLFASSLVVPLTQCISVTKL